MDATLGWALGLALGPVSPKCTLGSFPLLISFMDVSLGWAVGPQGALGPVISRILGSFPFLISCMDVTLG
eukprot:4803155-Karenia_brevis.AAC.1